MAVAAVAAVLAAGSAMATGQTIDLSIQMPSLQGYFVSIDVPTEYEWITSVEGSDYDATGPPIMVKKVSLQGETIEAVEWDSPHQLTVFLHCTVIGEDVREGVREAVSSEDPSQEVYEEGYLDLDGHEAYYFFARDKTKAVEWLEHNRFRIAIAIPEASRWRAPGWLETPCVILTADSVDPTIFTVYCVSPGKDPVPCQFWHFLVSGQPCLEKGLENLRHLLGSISISAPPIAHIAGYGYYLRRAGSDEWVRMGREETVYLSLGDSIRAEEAMEVSLLAEGPLELLGGYDMRIAADTAFTLRPTRMELVWGKIRSIFRGPKTKYDIYTPVLVLGVRGTDLITDVEEGQTVLLVLNGSVEARDVGGKRNVTVKAGEMLTATLSGITDPCRFDTALLGERYGSLFRSQEEIESVVGAIPEFPLLLTGCIVGFLLMRVPRRLVGSGALSTPMSSTRDIVIVV